MAYQNSMLQIMNAALLAEGQEEILSENEGTVEWRLLFRNWPFIVETELETGNYFFSREQEKLITRTDGKFGYDDGFLKPPAALHVRRVWLLTETGDQVEPDWIQDSSYVYVNSDDGCWVEYLVSPDESLWTTTFANGIKMRLQALICRAIKEESGEADRRDQEAEMIFQRARTSSTKGRRAQKPFRKGSISTARRG